MGGMQLPGVELTTEYLQRFVGGQIEAQNEVERYMYRGAISAIRMEGNDLVAELAWMAKGEGGPPIPSKWVVDDNKPYRASMEIYSVSNIGPSGGEVGGGDRICLQSFIVNETTILFPADGSKLDPAKVEGLQQIEGLPSEPSEKRAPGDFRNYVEQPNGDYKCKTCGADILAAPVIHPAWRRGGFTCEMADPVRGMAPYCPNCETMPGPRGELVHV